MSQIRVGDVFEAGIDHSAARFFQYVADDVTQLNSQVVRVFRETYDVKDSPDVPNVVAGKVDFHAHVFLRIGLRQGFWRKVGHAPPPSNLDVLFRGTNDSGKPEIKISHNWHVWRVNEPFEKVGDLPPHCQGAEIGVVVPPDSLVYRMLHGRYDFVYPDY